MKLVSLLTVGVLVGCASAPKAMRASLPGISDRVWVLQALQGERVAGGRIATLQLNFDHTITGTLACNDVGPGKPQWVGVPGKMRGTINAEGAGAGIVTAVGCSDTSAVGTADRFWRLMNAARTWSLDRGGLSITFADGSKAYLIPVKP